MKNKEDGTMEKVLNKLETILNEEIDNFKSNPIKSAIKLFILAWLVKKAYNFIKEA
jgi:hypothetical protein